MGIWNTPTREFRRIAMRVALTSGRTGREIVEDLGIGFLALTLWRGKEWDVRESSEAQLTCVPSWNCRCERIRF